MDKAWKRFERAIAKAVGGRRIPVTGLDRAGSDVDGGPFQFQCKLGRRMPSYLREWIDGIAATAKARDATGIVVWKQPGERVNDSVVILRLAGWLDWHGPATLHKEKPAGYQSGGPVNHVHGVHGVHDEKPGNGGDQCLERTARLGSSATGYLVNSKPEEIYDADRKLKEAAPSR